MAYSITLANRVREYLAEIPHITVEEKAMFGGLAFLVNDKMCINIGEDSLMCRFDPEQTEEIAERQGFSPVVMRGKELSGYCYVDPTGYNQKKDFDFWLQLCLEFNSKAKSSKKKNKNDLNIKKSLWGTYLIGIFVSYQLPHWSS